MAGVRLVINMHAKDGMIEDFIKAWDPHYDVVNPGPGCNQYELFRSTRNPDNMALLEHWESVEAFNQHWDIEKTRPRPTQPFGGEPGTRKIGSGGLEIHYEHQRYRYDGQKWVPA